MRSDLSRRESVAGLGLLAANAQLSAAPFQSSSVPASPRLPNHRSRSQSLMTRFRRISVTPVRSPPGNSEWDDFLTIERELNIARPVAVPSGQVGNMLRPRLQISRGSSRPAAYCSTLKAIGYLRPGNVRARHKLGAIPGGRRCEWGGEIV